MELSRRSIIYLKIETSSNPWLNNFLEAFKRIEHKAPVREKNFHSPSLNSEVFLKVSPRIDF